MLMVRMIEMIQEHDTSFVPLIVPFLQEPADKMVVPQLSGIIAAEKSETPNFFVLNPLTDQVVPFPEKLDDVKNFSPDLMLLWARRTILYLEIEFLEGQVKAFEDGERNEKLTEE